LLIRSAPDEEEDSCSTKRVSVLDAEGGPQVRESPQGDSSQSLRARHFSKLDQAVSVSCAGCFFLQNEQCGSFA
jgi:hypothetical protein